MKSKIFNINLVVLISSFLILNSCGGKLPGADARKISPNPADRVKKNLEEGKGFRLMGAIEKRKGGGNFEFASSNELWRASLDIIDFMPLASVNYSGGIIVTDWYSENQGVGESIKISIRFLSNEIRADALDINVFYKKCKTSLDCQIQKQDGKLRSELTKSILKQATIYKKQNKDKNFQPYIGKIGKN